MNKQTETLSKATPKLPLTIDKPEASNGYAYVRDADGIEVCTCYGRGEESAALIVQAVNEYEAHTKVAKALQCIMNANNSGNNGAYMGEAVVCKQFEAQANAALAALEAVRKGIQ